MKPCPDCGRSEGPFYFRADGRRIARCKPCKALHSKAENIRRKTVNAKHAAGYVARYPEKRAAHQAVARALKEGVLSHRPCHCGSTKSQAHHDDYSKPLDVIWLCPTHHRARHRERGIAQIERVPRNGGATWHKQIGRWVSSISINGTNTYLGCFSTKEEAQAAYAKARTEHT